MVVDRKANALNMKRLGVKNPARVWAAIDGGAEQWEIDKIIGMLLLQQDEIVARAITLMDEPIGVAIFGGNLIEQAARDDMQAIAHLPHITRVALMPDAHRVKLNHVPVGGVVLSDSSIFPGIVGSDIGCSVHYSSTDMIVDPQWFDDHVVALRELMIQNTYFGHQSNPNDVSTSDEYQMVISPSGIALLDQGDVIHNVEDLLVRDDSRVLLNRLVKMLPYQFGTSGDGNHFVEIGYSNFQEASFSPHLIATESGMYALSLLSHFGSRGIGATVSDHFLRVANQRHLMPKGMEDNAPLFFGDDDGYAEDYWTLMNWAGQFAKYSHQWLHLHLMGKMKEAGLYTGEHYHRDSIYTRHNFAWNTVQGYIHRKGATPAYRGVLGVIPATMGHSSRIVIGLGNENSLNSASHGAGRVMSRSVAIREIVGDTHEYVLENYGVTLIGGDKDEHPSAYKDIAQVMEQQRDCVATIGQFTPKIVRMADPRQRW